MRMLFILYSYREFIENTKGNKMYLKPTDQFHTDNQVINFVESYLHLDGFGRKFSLVKAKGHTLKVEQVNDPMTVAKFLGNAVRIASYVLLAPLALAALSFRSYLRSQYEFRDVTGQVKSVAEHKKR